jgi:signal transduction histidine kinase/ActR/RegA family two-component response regulator
MADLRGILRRGAASVRTEIRNSLAPASAGAEEETFEEFAALRTLRATRAIIVSTVLGNLLFAPFDLMTYPDNLPLAWALVRVRFIFGLIGTAGYLLLRFARLETAAWQAIGVGAAMSVYFFGRVGNLVGLEGPYFYLSFGIPAATMVCLFRLRERIAATAVLSTASLLASHIANPENISHRFNLLIVAYLFFSSVMSVAAGHVRYRLERDGFHQRQRLRRYAREQEELNRMKDAFVVTVSHELRTPLNAIIGLTDAALDEPASPRLKQFLQTMSNSEQVLLRLVNDILDLAKAKSGKLELRPEPASMQELIRTVVEFFTVACQEKGLALRWRVADDVTSVVVDPGRVQQIVLNLINNAVKFTERGSIQIEVSALRKEGTAPTLQIVVSDTGVGIAAHQAEVVFEEFIQVDTTTTRRHGGTGLGLPIVRRLAQLMGGDVTLAPNVPTGSVFTVHLPLVPAPAGTTVPLRRRTPSAALPAIVVSPLPTMNASVGGPRILVADDVVENRHILGVFLESLECEVVFADNGRSALEQFRTQRFDLAILDIEMPELDGYAAVREMRAFEVARGVAPIPIVALTAHGLDEHRERAEEAGFSSHLSKPIRKHELLAFVRETTGAVPRPLVRAG